MQRHFRIIVLSCLLAFAACSAVQPALKTLAIAFGQDLISSASVNYSPRYAEQVESLLLALARKGTGLDLEPRLAATGYQPPGPDYNGRQQNSQDNKAYSASESYDPDYDYYDSAGYDDPGYTSSDYDSGDYSGDYDGLALDVAIFVQRAGSTTLEPLEDGDVLYDGGFDPARGDLLRFAFLSNQDTHVYVIGIDATGYVAQIFPDPEEGTGSFVQGQREYRVPQNGQWWGLDAQAGVEQVFFVASATPREDIEQVVNGLLRQPRQLATNRYEPVRRPAIVRTRGLVKVGGSQPAANQGMLTKATYYSPEQTSEVVLTRWFMHESRL
jgi:hypothetical protein